jgi:hypothetical protein
VAVCLAGNDDPDASLAGCRVHSGLADMMLAVRQSKAGAVAVLASPS